MLELHRHVQDSISVIYYTLNTTHTAVGRKFNTHPLLPVSAPLILAQAFSTPAESLGMRLGLSGAYDHVLYMNARRA